VQPAVVVVLLQMFYIYTGYVWVPGAFALKGIRNMREKGAMEWKKEKG